MPAWTEARGRRSISRPAVPSGAGGLLEGQPQVVRQGVEAPSPEREVLVTAARAGVPEPVDVVVVLGGWGRLRQSPRVGLRHLLPEEGERSLVGQDVVQREQQDARVRRRFIDELHADQRPVREVEGPAGLSGGDRQRATVLGLDPLDDQRRRRVDDLTRSVPVCLKRGLQQPMPRHHPRERLLQPRHVQHAADAEGAAQVVGGRARVQLVHEPEAALHLAQVGRFPGGPGHQVEPARAGAGLLRLDGPLKPIGAVARLLGADHRRMPSTQVAVPGHCMEISDGGRPHQRRGATAHADSRSRDLRSRRADPLRLQPLMRARRPWTSTSRS